MKIKESQLRALTRELLKELFTKKNPLTLGAALSGDASPEETSSGGGGYDDFGDDGGGDYFESDENQMEEDEEDTE